MAENGGEDAEHDPEQILASSIDEKAHDGRSRGRYDVDETVDGIGRAWRRESWKVERKENKHGPTDGRHDRELK